MSSYKTQHSRNDNESNLLRSKSLSTSQRSISSITTATASTLEGPISLPKNKNAKKDTPLRPLTLKVRFEKSSAISRATVAQMIQEQYGRGSLKGLFASANNVWLLTLSSEKLMDALLENGIVFTDIQGDRNVAYPEDVSDPMRTVILSALDPEIPDGMIIEILTKFGTVQSRQPLRRELEDGIENGKRTLKMTIREHIPQKIRITNSLKEETEFFVSYPNQTSNLKLHTYNV